MEEGIFKVHEPVTFYGFCRIGNDKSEGNIQILDETVVQCRVATGDPSGSKRLGMEFF